MIHPQPHLAALAPYGLVDMAVAPGKAFVSLAQNESALPPSPRALLAAEAALADSSLYADSRWTFLREAIAQVHRVDPNQILCGAGSMELISILMQAFTGPGDAVLTTQYAYAFFQTAARISRAEYVAVAETEMTVSVDALLAGVTPSTRLVCVANPGNPSGTRIPGAEIRRLRDGLPGDVLLLVDEAYGEFADDLDDGVFDLVERGDTLVFRTFSKAYGLAGMRVGWGLVSPAIAAEMRKVQNPGSITNVSLAAAAAAMSDQTYMRRTVIETSARRDGFIAGLRGVAAKPIASHTNFVLMDFGTREVAASADRALRAEGVLMRGMAGYGLPQCLRATIGRERAMTLASETLKNWSQGECP